MAIYQKLQVRLSQRLILTPALQQAIKLLPMTTLELMDMLNQEVVENPLLEELSPEEVRQPDTQVEKTDPDPEPTTEKQDTWNDADYEYFFGDYLDDGYRARVPREVKELTPIENTLSTASSLADHLTWQMSVRTDDDLLRNIGTAIIGNLDDDGYLVASIEEIAAMGNLAGGRSRTYLEACAGLRPGWRSRPGPSGMPAASAPAPGLREHAKRSDRARAPTLPPKQPNT